MSYMFKNATSFKQDISKWSPFACRNMEYMFDGCDLNSPDSNTNQDHYNALLASWGSNPKILNMSPNVIFSVGSSKYSSSQAISGCSNLNSIKTWTISDGGRLCLYW